jgi:hypothetical protein
VAEPAEKEYRTGQEPKPDGPEKVVHSEGGFQLGKLSPLYEGESLGFNELAPAAPGRFFQRRLEGNKMSALRATPAVRAFNQGAGASFLFIGHVVNSLIRPATQGRPPAPGRRPKGIC